MVFRKKGEEKWRGEGAKTKNKESRPAVRKVRGGGVNLESEPEGEPVKLLKGTPQQEAVWHTLTNTGLNVIIKALAGTGKTTTVVQGLHRIGKTVIPETKKTYSQGQVAFIAFNKSIAAELATKVPSWVRACTCHSLMFSSLRQNAGSVEINEDKTKKIMEDIVGGEQEYLQLRRQKPQVIPAVDKLVGLAKNTLVGYDVAAECWNGVDENEVLSLAMKYSVDLNDSADDICELVIEIVERSMDLRYCQYEIDFDDQLWLPVVKNYQLPQFDLLCVDECQDLNAVQQEAILRMGNRLLLVGDENQAIYGFRGADIEAMRHMEDSLVEGAEVLPLTYTRRCPKTHVKLAQEIVPGFEAMDEAPEGTVLVEDEEVAELKLEGGDMVICRTNAPVVSMAFRLIARNQRANIQGRDLGQGLLSLIKKLGGPNDSQDVDVVLDRLVQYEEKEMRKLSNKKNPSEAAMEALRDKCQCVRAVCKDSQTIGEVRQKVFDLFKEVSGEQERNFILLSSVHRAKGLEAEKVVILEHDKMRHPMAKNAAERQQELNIKYVALTRSRNTLVLCPTPESRKRPQSKLRDGWPSDC